VTDPWAGERETWAQTSDLRPLSNLQILGGIPVSFADDDFHVSGQDSDNAGYLSETGSSSVLSTSGSIVSGTSSTGEGTPSGRPLGIILRGGASTHEISSEYHVASTCREFVGPSDPFSLRLIYNNLPHDTFSTHPPSSVATANTTSMVIEESTSLAAPGPTSNFHLGTYDNPSNLEHARSVFSPLTYTPDAGAVAIARSMVSLPQASNWGRRNDGDQEGGDA